MTGAGGENFGGWRGGVNGQQELSPAMFVYPLIKAMQDLSAEVNNLQAQISGSSDFSTLKTAVTGTQSNKKFITVIKRRSYNGREQSRRI